VATVVIDKLGKDHPGPKGSVTKVLGEISIEIADGELLVLVGPSGCGKSTLLRCIAGLETPTRGRILIDGKDVSHLEPRDRDIAMVFQSYALYPHLTVRENLAFGLKMRQRTTKMPPAEIEKRVGEAAAMLGLEALLERRPAQLSGGQRQRVAMGRAVVRRPKAFLFDEPLSNLDASLRGQMRVELMRLHQRLAATMVYVTHDQVEAMTLADRIAVLEKGRLMQVGAPGELYARPANLFVARFIGTPEMNVVSVEAARRAGLVAIDLPDGAAHVGVRAEGVTLSRPQAARGAIGGEPKATVDVVEQLGWEALVHLMIDEIRLVARVESGAAPRPGDVVRVALEPEALHLFDAAGDRVEIPAARRERA
jgi:sn-glycerol 3-phosphate transport system ATP-binding protein